MFNLNHIPLLRLLLPFIAGIIGVVYLKPNHNIIEVTFCLLLVALGLLMFVNKLNTNYNFRWIYGLMLYLCFLFAGAILTGNKLSNTNPTYPANSKRFIGEVIAPKQTKNKSFKYVLQVKAVQPDSKWGKINFKALLYLEKDSLSDQLNIGDLLIVNNHFKSVDKPSNPHEFDFSNYLANHLIFQQAYLKSDEWKIIKKGNKYNLFRLANTWRLLLISNLKNKGITGNQLAIASALILGDKNELNPELKQAYSSAGAMHVLAVSGLHVGIIYLIFSYLFSFLNKTKKGKYFNALLMLLVLWFYALITGLSPSVMRAATMFSFIVLANTFNRKSSFFNTLSASCLALLIFNPLLIMEVGFQLSYIAVIGIVLIQPWINNWFEFRYWIPQKIWEITAVSIAAQLTTFPLGLLYFHQFPNYFMLSNLIVIPLALSILVMGLITLCCSPIPYLSDLLALVLNYLIQFLNKAVGFIDELPYSLSENIKFGIIDTWLTYLIICCLVVVVAYRKFKFLVVAEVLIVFLLGYQLYDNYVQLNHKEIIIYKIPKHTCINYIESNINLVIADSSLIANQSKLLFHVQNNWINKRACKPLYIPIESLAKLKHHKDWAVLKEGAYSKVIE